MQVDPTELILLFALDSITQASDAGQVACTAFLDFSKALIVLYF